MISSAPTLSKQDVLDMQEAIYLKAFTTPDITQSHRLVQGIKGSRRIAIGQPMTGLSGFVKEDCDITASSASTSIGEKTWAPAYISDRHTYCYEDAMGTMLQWMLKDNKGKEDITGTDVGLYIEQALAPHIREMILQKAWFADTAIAAGTNNNVTAGQVKYFDMFDGYFKQIFALNGGLPHSDDLSTKNAQITYELQKFTAADATNQVVTKCFLELYYASDVRLRGMDTSNLQILVTQSVYDQYERERLAVSATLESTYVRLENGVKALQFMGIPVIPMQIWDRTIRSYFGNDATPTFDYLPHRVVFTTKDNLLLGIESTNGFDSFDADYDKYNKKYYADWGVSLSPIVGINEYVAAAY
jgi:hypothetical protein